MHPPSPIPLCLDRGIAAQETSAALSAQFLKSFCHQGAKGFKSFSSLLPINPLGAVKAQEEISTSVPGGLCWERCGGCADCICCSPLSTALRTISREEQTGSHQNMKATIGPGCQSDTKPAVLTWLDDNLVWNGPVKFSH